MVWNYHDEDKQEAAEEINIVLDGLPAEIDNCNRIPD
jgi:hypothetical protein